ncbi:MAG: histidine triad nucleotide-binding protein [Pseudohongiella sp.]|jgi:histidine triad (HIT) family protein|nr:histidine triad nucleotide-binding protein [Pseudohongiella sp.]
MSDDCLFCKIIAGEIPSNKVYSDDDSYAFHDINPAAPVHVLVVPKKHICDMQATSDADEALLGNLLLKANKIAEILGLKESGYRFVINTGPDSGRTIYHLHLHILGGRQLELSAG